MADKYTEDLQQKIKKLPQWAQNYITRLERDVAKYRELLTQTDDGQTAISWTDYTNEKHLPDRGVIRYKLSNGTLEVSLKEDRLELRSDGFDGALAILPAYSNMFYTTIVLQK